MGAKVDNGFLAVHLKLIELLQCLGAVGRSGRRIHCLEEPLEWTNAIASLDRRGEVTEHFCSCGRGKYFADVALDVVGQDSIVAHNFPYITVAVLKDSFYGVLES